ncbi:MAG: IPExxxVDY family protein [Sphingobacteriaceae bacterium]
MNKLTLKFELDFDFTLIAITSSLKDYRLCYQINKALQVNFVRTDELSLSFSSEKNIQNFNRYVYYPPNSETEFFLLANKGSEGLLIPEMNKVDYFLLIRNFIDEEDLNYWISHIKKISEVLAAVEIEPQRLKSKENLLF